VQRSSSGFGRRSLWLLTLLAGAACSARAPHVIEPSGAEIGVASWYGPGFHGKATTSGEIYDQDDMTAAHPSLPLGTRCLVTNLENGRVCEVRINDRGPFARGRAIDLSHAAAETLGVIGPGTANVRIEPMRATGAASFAPLRFAVQVGAFTDVSLARGLRGRVATLGEVLAGSRPGDREVYITLVELGPQRYFRVRVGPFNERSEAEVQALRLAGAGLTTMIVEDDGRPLE
jgi:rare lipoprotein A